MQLKQKLNRQHILQTLIYSDIFDFPLTIDELYLYLHNDVSSSVTLPDKQIIKKTIEDFVAGITTKEGYVCLQGKEDTIRKRKEREIISKKKLQEAMNLVPLLAWIPTIEVLGVSGAVAVYNADEQGDIDLFVIAQANTLWFTRACILLVLLVLGKRSSRGFCLNMLLASDALLLSKEKQDIYTAHEVMQLLPLVTRHQTYEAFIQANAWIETLLPNVYRNKVHQMKKVIYQPRKHPAMIFDTMAALLQRLYMGKIQQTYELTGNVVAFYKQSYRHDILTRYTERIRSYGL